MLWFWFTVGLIFLVLGMFLYSCNDDIVIANHEFDSNSMGELLLVIGGILTVIMLFALGIRWMESKY